MSTLAECSSPKAVVLRTLEECLEKGRFLSFATPKAWTERRKKSLTECEYQLGTKAAAATRILDEYNNFYLRGGPQAKALTQ
jgi:hypothetical protein